MIIHNNLAKPIGKIVVLWAMVEKEIQRKAMRALEIKSLELSVGFDVDLKKAFPDNAAVNLGVLAICYPEENDLWARLDGIRDIRNQLYHGKFHIRGHKKIEIINLNSKTITAGYKRILDVENSEDLLESASTLKSEIELWNIS